MNKEILHTKIAVVLNARNEEKNIGKTLEFVLKQELQPYRIIVVNDGSTDKTGEIASSFESVEVINRPVRKESYLARKELAETINAGLRKLHDDKECEYVWLMGSDILFPNDYLNKIIKRIKTNPKIVIASGIVQDEFSIEPRGSGRVISCDFWRKLGFLYPVNYGWEGYLVWKAQSMGYDTVGYPDIISQTDRKTGTKFNSKRYYYYGLAMKALGYTSLYTIFKILLFSKRNSSGAYYMLKGYFSQYDDLYEPELREYVRKIQLGNMFNLKSPYIHRFLNILSKSK